MIRFNYYAADIKKSAPLGTIDIYQFFNAIREPKPHIIDVYSKIKQAELNGDLGLKAKLKESLFSFTPCVLVNNRRAYADIQSFTGLMVLDFDHITPKHAIEFKEYLFETYHFIIATWLSASKCGVRAMVNIPVVQTVDEFQALYSGMEQTMNRYEGFDHAPYNPVLPLFLSHDPDIICGDTDVVWNTKYYPVVSKPIEQYKYNENPTKVEKIIKAAIDKIHDNGHPQLRGAAFALGGYVGAGYIDQDSAVQLINNLIRTNSYLSQKPEVYIRTASEMINKGTSNPLYI